MRDAKGALYGTTEFGGALGGGVAYSMTTTGSFAVLHDFAGSDGADLLTPMIVDSAGNLYGTTTEGGAQGRDGIQIDAVTSAAPGVSRDIQIRKAVGKAITYVP